MRYWIYSIIITFILLTIGCEKDKMNIKEQCEELEALVDMQGMPLFYQVYPSYGVPCFNPNNPDEIIFFYAKENAGPPHKLVKYNLSSKEYQTIYEGQFGIRPRWSKKGWILLSLWNELGNDGFNIWKIKENGDSLTQLTTTGNCFAPEWNKNGDKFIYQFANVFPDPVFITADVNGVAIDTFLVGTNGGGSWQHDSLFSYTDIYGLYLGDLSKDSAELLFEVESPNSISKGGTEWVDDSNIIWSHLDGIYITNIHSEETTRIIGSCNSEYYQLPTYSPQIDKVVFQRVDRVKTDNEIGNLFTGLYIMNLDGTCEEKIEIIE